MSFTYNGRSRLTCTAYYGRDGYLVTVRNSPIISYQLSGFAGMIVPFVALRGYITRSFSVGQQSSRGYTSTVFFFFLSGRTGRVVDRIKDLSVLAKEKVFS